jgi:hypothetical protein
MEAKEFSVEECKVMDSKKVPLWLSVKPNCENDEEEKFQLMFDLMQKEKEKINKDEEELNLNNVSIPINEDIFDAKNVGKDEQLPGEAPVI